jgi:hypothetical protein
VDLISHPFRLKPNGAVATVEDGTVSADAEGLAVMALTRRGERDQLPTFGIPDPVFDALSVADLNVALADHGPDIVVTAVSVTRGPTETTERVELTFDRADTPDQE